MSDETEWVLVKRDDLLRWAEDFARDNDPGDDTDVVAPFDDYLLRPPAEAQPVAKLVNRKDADGGKTTTFIRPTSLGMDLPLGEYPLQLHPSAPVGVEGLVAMYREAFISERARNYRAEGMGVEQARIHAEADVNAAEAALAQQPEAVDGVWLRPVIKQGDYVAKWGFCNPEEPDAVCFFPSPQQGGES